MLVIVVIMVMSILARLLQLASVSLSMRIGVVMILRQILRTRWLTGGCTTTAGIAADADRSTRLA